MKFKFKSYFDRYFLFSTFTSKNLEFKIYIDKFKQPNQNIIEIITVLKMPMMRN